MQFNIFNYFWDFIQTFNYTALIYAALEGHSEVVDKLLSQSGIEINHKDI